MNAPPAALRLDELLARQAVAAPDAVCAEDSQGRRLTYREFDALCGRLAAKLRDLGVRRGDRVGICMPKSINSLACVFGALRAGAAYVPVDYSAPAERNRFIFTNCDARVICADEPRAAALRADCGNASKMPDQSPDRSTPAQDPALLAFPGAATASVGAPFLDNLAPLAAAPDASETDLAYILYTSGSTGVPKGVMHTHASALSFVYWAARVFEPNAADRFSSHAPFHFDLSILDLYVPMTAGAAVVLVDDELGKQPHLLAPFIADKRISIWYSVPSILALMAQFGKLERHDYSALRTVLFAGEVFPVKHLRALRSHWRRPAFWNLYGPTETNVCTYYRVPDTIPDERTTPFPIGKVCENCRGRVLDEGMSEVSGAVEGVLYIHQSGPVMSGYWNLPENNAKAFYVDANGQRWYRTGDVVYADEQDDLIFVGRRDRMVKRRGYRIELGEIEAGLYKHPQIREAAAIAREQPEGVQIVVFLSGKTSEPLSPIALKQFCAANLPAYMIPDRFELLPDLPRTSTGKVDYQALMRRG
ncbi:MAG: amino acid adenylation domain-containing protein [Phycisphaerae bacterium]